MLCLVLAKLSSMEHLTANLVSKRALHRMLNGRAHLVVPVTMIVPGILDGSQGRVLYTKEENEKSVSAWNGVPITVYHPATVDNKPISARDTAVLSRQGIGTVLEARSNGKLTAMAWIDIQNALRIDRRIVELIERGKPIEVSTGLFIDTVPGDDPTYVIAKNYRPDHLAILPDQVGACSIKDGCGMFVNSTVLNAKGISHEQLRANLEESLRANFTQDEPSPYIEEIYDDSIVFSHNGKLWKMKYNLEGESLTLSTKGKKEVSRKVEYVPVATTNSDATDNSDLIPSIPSENKMAKKELIDSLVSNCSCWKEEDRKALNQLTDERLQELVDNSKKSAEDSEASKKNLETLNAQSALLEKFKKGFQIGENQWTFDDKGQWAVVTNYNVTKQQKPKEKPETEQSSTMELPNDKNVTNRLTPEEIEDLTFARNERNRQKKELVLRITANVGNEQKEGVSKLLMEKSLDELNTLVALAPPTVRNNQFNESGGLPNYAGSAAPIGTYNRADYDKKDILPLPTINWQEERKAEKQLV